MPATSKRQQKLFGIALSVKRGETSRSYSSEATELADSMTEEQLKDYAETSFEGNPNFIYDLYLFFSQGWWF